MTISGQQQEAFEKYFAGMPLKEAEADLYIHITAEEAVGGAPGDPENCAIAMSCRRVFGSTAVVIMRSIAYVDLEGTVYRFQVPKATLEKIIRPIDAGLTAEPGMYRLKKPGVNKTLEQQHVRNAKRDARLKAQGKPTRPVKRYPPRFVMAGHPGFLRNGSGHIRKVAQ